MEIFFQILLLCFFGAIAGLCLGIGLAIHHKYSPVNYVGALPLLCSLAFCYISAGISTDQTLLLFILILISLPGFFSDKYGIPGNIGLIINLFLLTGSSSIILGSECYISVIIVTIIIFLSLKVSSLVFEAPLILCIVSSSTLLVYFMHFNQQWAIIVALCSILVANTVILIYSTLFKRALAGNGGLCATGLLLALIVSTANQHEVYIITSFLPLMVFVFSTFFILFFVVSSYFGNQLHSERKKQRRFQWKLKRTDVLYMTVICFLSLNLLYLFHLFDARTIYYLTLLSVFLLTTARFIIRYAGASPDSATNHSNKSVILGFKIDCLNKQQVLNQIETYLRTEHKQPLMHVITADSLAILRALQNTDFAQKLENAGLVIPDGAGIIWASDFLGCPLPERIPGVGLTVDLCKLAADNKWKVYLIGAKTEVIETAAQKLKANIKNLDLCAIRDGYMTPEKEEAALKEIERLKPNLIFIGMGVPMQEEFISKIKAVAQSTVAIGVGGSFDVISEKLPRAPRWMQRCALEWLFRLWLQPARFKRMLNIPVFITEILRHKWNSNH